jgi:hypothetical protein
MTVIKGSEQFSENYLHSLLLQGNCSDPFSVNEEGA